MMDAIVAVICTGIICLTISKVGDDIVRCLRATLSTHVETKSLLRQLLDHQSSWWQ